MRRSLILISVGTLLVIGVALVGHMFEGTIGPAFTPTGQPIASTTSDLVVMAIVQLDGILGFPLSLATFILGLIATVKDKQTAWVGMLLVAGVLGLMTLLWLIWNFLSTNNDVTFSTSMVLIPLVALCYGLRAKTESSHTS